MRLPVYATCVFLHLAAPLRAPLFAIRLVCGPRARRALLAAEARDIAALADLHLLEHDAAPAAARVRDSLVVRKHR